MKADGVVDRVLRSAPWLEPLVGGLVLLFFVAGPIPRRAHEQMLGPQDEIQHAIDSIQSYKSILVEEVPGLPDNWVASRLEEIKTLQIPDFILQILEALITRAETATELTPRLLFINDGARWITFGLLAFLGLAVSLGTTIISSGPATSRPYYQLPRQRYRRKLAQLRMTLPHAAAPLATSGALVVVVTYLLLSFHFRDLYFAPRNLPDRILASLACPSELSQPKVKSERMQTIVAELYASFLGTTPQIGPHLVEKRDGKVGPATIIIHSL